jgi:hypothetical protein
MAFRGQDQFRTDPTGVLARGAPSGGGGGGFPIGGINRPNIPSPVQSAGSMGPGPRVGGGLGISVGSGGRGGDSAVDIMRGTGRVKKKAKGGKVDMAQDKATIKKAFKQHDAQKHKGSGSTKLKLAKGGSASSRADGCATKGKTKGRFV